MQTPCLLTKGGRLPVRTGPGCKEPARLLQMPQTPVRAQHLRRASAAFSPPERGRHGPPGLHGTQAFELSPACPREAPLAGTRLPWAGTWKPWEQLYLQSTWIPTLMLFCLWERTFEETSGRLSSPSPPSLGRRALALHGPTALSRLGFPRIPW